MDQNLPSTTDTTTPNTAPVNPMEATPVMPAAEQAPIQTAPMTQTFQEPVIPQPSLETPTQQPAFATNPVMEVSAQPTFTPPVSPEQNTFSQSTPESNTTPPAGSKKIAIAAVVGGILLFIAIGALYVLALKNNAPTTTQSAVQQPVTPSPTEVVTSTEEDLQSIQSLDAGDPTEEIKAIDTDLGQL